MSAAAIIFNGLHFEPSVAARAFAHAKQAGGSVIAIFLKTAPGKKKGCVFPGDTGLAENFARDKEAADDDRKIIESNIRLLKHQALAERVDVHTQLLEEPAAQQLRAMLKDADLLFIQGHDEHGDDTPAGVDVKHLLKGITIPIEIVQ